MNPPSRFVVGFSAATAPHSPSPCPEPSRLGPATRPDPSRQWDTRSLVKSLAKTTRVDT